MFDSRIFYLQMTGTRHRPQVLTTVKRRDPRLPAQRGDRRGAAR